jgi:ferredoxin
MDASSRFGRRRAWVLGLVQVVLIAHVLWWVATGEAVAPLEPSEGMAFARDGEVNPGLVLFLLAGLATMVFGRFFCGWACHLLALQDGARWILMKLGIRPSPFKSRLLRLVPLAAFVYMFLWPFIERMWLGLPQPGVGEFRWTTHAFWATFPGPVVSVLTLLLAGGAVIWLLGSKAYCTYACPYGALFGAADAVAPGRIRVDDSCAQCAKCTAACSSDVRVHEEVRDFGTVMDAGCMKCMDCVAACPNDALRFGFGAPAAFTKARAQGRRSRVGVPGWDEELVLVLGYALGFFGSYRLYGSVPLLMALAMGMVGAWAAWTVLRLLRRPEVRLQGVALKLKRRWRAGGVAALAASLLFLLGSGHGLWIRGHEAARDRAWNGFQEVRNQVLQQGFGGALAPEVLEAATAAADEARWLERHGLMPQALNAYAIAWERLLQGDHPGFQDGVEAVLALRPGFGEVLFQYGYYWQGIGDDQAALDRWAAISPRDPRFLDAALSRIHLLRLLQRADEAALILTELRERGYEEEELAGLG